jgi:hypothetical protein
MVYARNGPQLATSCLWRLAGWQAQQCLVLRTSRNPLYNNASRNNSGPGKCEDEARISESELIFVGGKAIALIGVSVRLSFMYNPSARVKPMRYFPLWLHQHSNETTTRRGPANFNLPISNNSSLSAFENHCIIDKIPKFSYNHLISTKFNFQH